MTRNDPIMRRNAPSVGLYQVGINPLGNEFRGLHEGNVIRYRVRPEDLKGISRK
jgi:hypothetical protein